MTESNTVTRELVVELSEAELRERGDLMAAAELEADRLKTERRQLNASIRAQTDERARLAGIIEGKRETREVPCEWRPDYRKKRWQLFRTDNKEALPEEREMTPADLQERLPNLSIVEDEGAAEGGGARRKPRERKAANKRSRKR